MSTLFQRVQPGDLITAAEMNDLFDEIESLEARVTALETGTGTPTTTISPVTITSVSPDPVQVGATLTITGTNFGVSTAGNTVLFDDVPAFSTLAGSSDTLLIVVVPDIPGLPAGGGSVALHVSNALFSASRTIHVHPAPIPQQGTVDIIFDGVTPDPITAATTNDFQFHLLNQATVQPVTLTLTPAIGGQPWTATILDDAHNPIAGNQITLLHHGDTKTFFVRVTIPSATNGTAFTLSVAGSGSGITSSSSIGSYEVGQFADPDTTFTLAPGAAPGVISGNTVTASASAPFGTTVPIVGSMTVAGAYDVTVALVPAGAAGWNPPTITAPGATGSPPVNRISVQPTDLGSPPHAVPESIQIRVKPQTATAAAAQLRVTVQRGGATQSRTLTFNLVAGA
jgi:IPT/TIG domain